MKTIALLSVAAIASSAHAMQAAPVDAATKAPINQAAADKPADKPTDQPTNEDLAQSTKKAKRDIDFVVGGGYAHFFSTDFDTGGGDVAVDRGFLSASWSKSPTTSYKWSIDVQSEESWYSFADAGTLAAAAGGRPWDNVSSTSISPGATFVLDPRWRLITRALLQFAGEEDADTFDSASYGGIVAASYSFSSEFTLGLGVLAISRIEDDVLIVPQVIIDWRPCAEFRLSNFAGPEAFPGGAGLEGIWMLGERSEGAYELALGGRYTYRRFRLDDTGAAPRSGGVGTDEGLPLWIRATLHAKCGARLDLITGVQLMGQMELDDSAGNELASVDVEPAPFVGIFFAYQF